MGLNHILNVIAVLVVFNCVIKNFNYVTCKVISLQSNGLVAALGDFDSDKLTDIFVINPDRGSFQILKATDKPDFMIDHHLECYASKKESIVGLIPGDFLGKAFMDVIVIARDVDHSSSSDDDQFNLFLVPGNRTHLNCQYLIDRQWFATVTNQPLALDYNGDMIVDLFGRDVDGQRYIYTEIKGSVVNRTKLTEQDGPNSNNGKIRSPNSNGFVDLDGDFRSDLIIEGDKSIEYWYHSLGGFKKIKEILYPEYALIGMSTYADVNADGMVDHILPVCGDSSCSSSSAILALDGYNNKWFVINDHFLTTTGSPSSLEFSMITDEAKRFNFPLKLRHADVDGDGYPDLIALMKPKDGANKNTVKVVILKNVKNETNILGRSFVPHWFIDGVSTSDSFPVLAAFADLAEDGKIDVLINLRSPGSKSNQYKLSAFLNDQMVDACFLKVLVTSGLCYGDCPSIETTIDGSTPASAIPYGTNQPGATITYQLIDTEGNKRIGFAGQLSQSSDFSLQMPYSIFGLGQLPNFVDNLTASIPAAPDNEMRVNSWSQIVPDAQVVVIPYPPNDPRIWRTKLFITPSDIVISTLITLACIMVLLALIILLLHRKEVLEDLAEHEEYKRHWPESR